MKNKLTFRKQIYKRTGTNEIVSFFWNVYIDRVILHNTYIYSYPEYPENFRSFYKNEDICCFKSLIEAKQYLVKYINEHYNT